MILVVGGTGELGGRVVHRLREQGLQVRSLIRRHANDAALRQLDATVVHGDLTQPDSLPPACEGIETVVASVTAMGRRLTGASDGTIREVDQVGMAALIDAAERTGVSRFIYVSSAGLDTSRATWFVRAKIAIERRLQASSMQAVLVRPDAFQETDFTPLGRLT